MLKRSVQEILLSVAEAAHAHPGLSFREVLEHPKFLLALRSAEGDFLEYIQGQVESLREEVAEVTDRNSDLLKALDKARRDVKELAENSLEWED